jgi:putative ABC transport system permease protein
VNPIGHAIGSPGLPPDAKVDIAGIVGDVRESGPTHAPEPLIYWCGYSPYWPDPHFIVRFDPARPVSIAEIRAALLEIEPKRAVYAARPLADTLSASISQQRLSAIMLALFAATTLLLAALGLYGVLSQLVTARRREIGVRMALGAGAPQIVASIAGQAALITTLGMAVGLAAALVLARFMATMVFGVATYDPLTFAATPVVLALVAAAAAIVPARRAAIVDPSIVLRE